MSSFQDNLDDEIKKRKESNQPSSSTPEEKIIYKKFSFKSFLLGLSFFSIILLSLIGWAWSKTEKTTASLVKNIPSKTAIVQLVDNNIDLTQYTQANTIQNTVKPDTADKANDKNTENKKTTLPKTNTGSKPYQANKAVFTPNSNKPLLSFVVYDLGLAESKTKKIIQNLPEHVALGFSPYGRNAQALTEMAVSDGHEVWVSLPLESKEYPLNDSGPSTLMVNASTEKNQVRLEDIIATTNKNIGFITPPYHVFKTEDANVNPAIKEIFNRGYAMIDSNIRNYSFLSRLADMKEYPYAQAHIWLDKDITPLSINKNIRKIVEYGQNKKNVIVMLRPYPASIKAMQKFVNSKVAEQFELAPVSAQLKNSN